MKVSEKSLELNVGAGMGSHRRGTAGSRAETCELAEQATDVDAFPE